MADFNDDGKNDIYFGDTGNSGGNAYIWFGKGGKSPQKETIASGVVGHNTCAADVDNDGDLDLVSKNKWQQEALVHPQRPVHRWWWPNSADRQGRRGPIGYGRRQDHLGWQCLIRSG